MKKKIQANELVDAECRYISLVPKGANRIPIRLTKSEEGQAMSLKGFEGVFKKEVSTAYVASIVVNKGADLDLAKAKIEKAGFKTDDVKEQEDGLTVFHQKTAPADLEHQYVVKTSDDMGVHVVCTKSFTPWDYETKSFKELFAKAGVLPNIFMAHEVLKDVITNSLYANDTLNSADATKSIKKALSEFSTIVTGMIEQIPVSAFKMEDPTLIEEVKKEMADKAEVNKEDSSNEEAKEKKEDEVEAKKADAESTEGTDEGTPEDKGEEAEEKGAEESEGEDAADEGDKVEKDDEPKDKEAKADDKKTGLEDIVKSIADLAEAVTALKKESVSGIEGLKGEFTKLEGKVEEVSKVAKSTDEAMNGMTNADAEDDKSVTAKTESAPSNMLRDTAYVPLK